MPFRALSNITCWAPAPAATVELQVVAINHKGPYKSHLSTSDIFEYIKLQVLTYSVLCVR